MMIVSALCLGTAAFMAGIIFQAWREGRAREIFPAPRETDCSYGCCHAGDRGLWSEAIPAATDLGVTER